MTCSIVLRMHLYALGQQKDSPQGFRSLAGYSRLAPVCVVLCDSVTCLGLEVVLRHVHMCSHAIRQAGSALGWSRPQRCLKKPLCQQAGAATVLKPFPGLF